MHAAAKGKFLPTIAESKFRLPIDVSRNSAYAVGINCAGKELDNQLGSGKGTGIKMRG